MHDEECYELRISAEFVEALSTIYSKRLLGHIKEILNTLRTTPEIGSADVRPCLRERYGTNIRKIPVSTFVIIYRIEHDTIDVLALVYGPSVI